MSQEYSGSYLYVMTFIVHAYQASLSTKEYQPTSKQGHEDTLTSYAVM